uniref:Uncharacterized protein n=1 Tax=Fagus sylvatica TaxID=28930 RepID=A0A2N9IF58_FAGSY
MGHQRPAIGSGCGPGMWSTSACGLPSMQQERPEPGVMGAHLPVRHKQAPGMHDYGAAVGQQRQRWASKGERWAKHGQGQGLKHSMCNNLWSINGSNRECSGDVHRLVGFHLLPNNRFRPPIIEAPMKAATQEPLIFATQEPTIFEAPIEAATQEQPIIEAPMKAATQEAHGSIKYFCGPTQKKSNPTVTVELEKEALKNRVDVIILPTLVIHNIQYQENKQGIGIGIQEIKGQDVVWCKLKRKVEAYTALPIKHRAQFHSSYCTSCSNSTPTLWARCFKRRGQC